MAYKKLFASDCIIEYNSPDSEVLLCELESILTVSGEGETDPLEDGPND